MRTKNVLVDTDYTSRPGPLFVPGQLFSIRLLYRAVLNGTAWGKQSSNIANFPPCFLNSLLVFTIFFGTAEKISFIHRRIYLESMPLFCRYFLNCRAFYPQSHLDERVTLLMLQIFVFRFAISFFGSLAFWETSTLVIGYIGAFGGYILSFVNKKRRHDVSRRFFSIINVSNIKVLPQQTHSLL